MINRCFLPIALVLAAGTAASAAPVFSFENLQSSYTPGTSFAFDLKLTGATNLNAYTVSLRLEGLGGTPGTGHDFFFEALPTNLNDLPAVNRYVFGSGGFGRGFSRGETGSVTKLTILDNLADSASSVSTTAGVNDFIARVRITTSATLTGPLRLSFDAADTLLLAPSGDDIPEFDRLTYSPGDGSATIVQAGPQIVVPEPASLIHVLLAGSFGLLAAWQGKHRRRARHQPRPSVDCR